MTLELWGSVFETSLMIHASFKFFIYIYIYICVLIFNSAKSRKHLQTDVWRLASQQTVSKFAFNTKVHHLCVAGDAKAVLQHFTFPIPYHPCIVYLPTFSWFVKMVNVGKYIIQGFYGNYTPEKWHFYLQGNGFFDSLCCVHSTFQGGWVRWNLKLGAEFLMTFPSISCESYHSNIVHLQTIQGSLVVLSWLPPAVSP